MNRQIYSNLIHQKRRALFSLPRRHQWWLDWSIVDTKWSYSSKVWYIPCPN